MDANLKKAAWITGAIALPVALLSISGLTFLVFLPDLASRFHQKNFDAVAWRAQDRETRGMWPTRLRIVDDLVENRKLDGLTRKEVEELLGPADTTAYFREWDLVYWLGPERGFIRIDSEWLVVRLDASSKVTEYRIVTD